VVVGKDFAVGPRLRGAEVMELAVEANGTSERWCANQASTWL